jgi:plastocyanin
MDRRIANFAGAPTGMGLKSAPAMCLLILFLAGCNKASSAPMAAAAAGDKAPVAVVAEPGVGVIRGRAILDGTAPSPRAIAGADCGIPGHRGVPDESLLVDSSGGIKNVIVYLKDAPANVPATQPVTLNQSGCRYVPHVLALQMGQIVHVTNGDTTLHNIHVRCAINPERNFGQASGDVRDISFAAAEGPFRVQCDVHPWMTAWVAVFDHPFFAVTGDDGSFEIRNIPAGDYTLVAWQESLPTRQKAIKIADAAPVDVVLTMKQP